MRALDAQLLAEFLKKAGDKLKGEWVLVGGTLLPAVGLHIRSTVDIDLVGLGQSEATQGLELMELAESLGLPVETINQAAAIFVKRANVKRSDLLPLVKGKSAKIFRPSVALYWQLKMARLTESDLLDCQHYFHFCRAQNDTIHLGQLQLDVKKAMKKSQDHDRLPRLAALLDLAASSQTE